MKNLFCYVVLLLMFVLLQTLVSCQGNGPQGKVVFPDNSTEEIVDETLEAARGDKFVYYYSAEMFYYDDGEWYSAGMHNVYHNLADHDGCNLWVDFDEDFKFPVEYKEKYGYRHSVFCRGTEYYF